VHGGIAVHLRRRGLEKPGLDTLCQAQHIDRPVHRRLGGLHGIKLVVGGGCRACEIVYFIHFHVKRKCDVVPQKFEARMAGKMIDIFLVPCIAVVHADDLMALIDKLFTQVRSKKTGPAGNQNSFPQWTSSFFVYPVYAYSDHHISNRKTAG